MAAIGALSLIRSGSRVLVASADPVFRSLMMKNREDSSSRSEEAVGGAHALSKLVHFSCDNVLLDRNLPDLDATEVGAIIRQRYPQTAVEFVDSRGDGNEVQNAQMCETNEKLHGHNESTLVEEHIQALPRPIPVQVEPLPGMIGSSRAIQQIYRLVHMVASRDTTVLIVGETGTGKELVALGLLEQANWPGNVRELQHAIERAFILSGEETQLEVEHFQKLGNSHQLREI